MYHDLPRAARFWSFLFAVDQDLAETARKQGCPCGGRLHCANYLRKPRGTPDQLPEPQRLRLSFCCDRDGCRKRVTPPSVRFLGRKVYLGAVVILISAMRQGPTPRRVRELSDTLRRRPTHHRSLAGLLARTLSPDTVLEGRTRPSGAGCRDRLPALLARGRLPPRGHRIRCTGLGRVCCAFSLRSRSPEACKSRSRDDRLRPQKMLVAHSDCRCIEVVTVPSPTL